MKKLLFAACIAATLAACSTEDGEELIESPTDYQSSTAVADATTMAFEGVWAIDGKAIGQGYVLKHRQIDDATYLELSTFPYADVARLLMPDEVQLADVSQPAQPQQLILSPVGYTATADYSEISASSGDDEYTSITCSATAADGTQTSVALCLLPNESTCMVSNQKLICLLAVKRIRVTPANGQPRQWVLNPARQLTFTSTKRI